MKIITMVKDPRFTIVELIYLSDQLLVISTRLQELEPLLTLSGYCTNNG
jgi:hypothetical protein